MESGALDNAPGMLNGISGTIYIDENGAVYRYDAAEGTASVVYWPDHGEKEIIIPASIPLKNGNNCALTSVENSAF